MKAIIIGPSLSGKTTLFNYLKPRMGIPLLEIDDELSRINNGEYPKDDKYKHEVLAPKIIKEILEKKNILFFTNTDYFTEGDLKTAREKGFKIIQLEISLDELKKRNESRVKIEGRDDWSQWFAGMLEYQRGMKDKKLIDKVASSSRSVELVAQELLNFLKKEISLPKIIIRPQTPEEEFDFLQQLLKRLPFYKKEEYEVYLPDHEEIYDEGFFDKGFKILEQQKKRITEAFTVFKELHKNWGFKVFPKYKILLTRYGPSGNYDADEGVIIIRTNSDGTFGKDDVLETIIHEMVHIGIEENIIQKFKLTHWEKEELIDFICQHGLTEILPDYVTQDIDDRKLEQYLSPKSLEDLPAVVAKYVKKHPR